MRADIGSEPVFQARLANFAEAELVALRHDRIDAPWFLEGPIDGDSLVAR